ncbi:MAG: T9SS type A sorting domain-containing protein, partial [Muribaculaceae bacterium]|nr:T9SS type A sorting domain-containing protein [Muribaculaceae bacterium]
VEKVPAKWTEYRFEVPAGTTHFAIRCISNRQFALFVDDITFERANPAADLQLIGYNVYRAGVRLPASPPADNAFSEPDEDAHRYLVPAVYDRGESAASNEAIVGSLASIIGPGQASDISITGSIGKIIVSGAEGKLIEVFGTDGKVIDRVKGSATTVIDTATGLYIVRVAGTATKTLVK